MIEESLFKSNFLGRDGFVWWIGQVADPSVWRNEKSRVDNEGSWAYRCKVRIIGYHTFDGNVLPDSDLPWAHVLTSASDGAPGQGGFGKLPLLIGGESVLGFFLDGEEAQQPVVVSCFYRNESAKSLITPELVKSERSSQFKPFPGAQGNLAVSNTRRKKRDSGTIQQPPTNTVASGPAVTFGVDTAGTIGLSSDFNPLSSGAGSIWSNPSLVQDQLFYSDASSIGTLKQFYDAGPVTDANGCTADIIQQIQSALQGFIGFVNGCEATALGFIDPIRNKIVDMRSKIKKVARLILSAMKFIMNGMRDNVIKLTGCLFRAFSITIPLPQWMQISEALRNVMDIIFCIFEKLFGPLFDFIVGMLQGLIGKSNNIPRCAASEAAASLIDKLASLVDDALASVLSGIDWLVGGIGQITGYLRTAVGYLQTILSFLSCDALQCKPTKTWDPFKGIQFPSTDEWAETIGKIDILMGLGDDVDEWTGLLSMYGSADTPFGNCREQIVNPSNQGQVQPMPPGVRFANCIPPEIIINGDGVGARAVAVVENNRGSLLTISVLNPGRGYTQPPTISILDNSGYGTGARARATINATGNIQSIYLESGGSGYCQTNLTGIGSTSAGIGSTSVGVGTTGTNIGISTVPVGIVTDVVVTAPGVGYTDGDSIQIGDCIYSPILTSSGSIIGITSANYCTSQFTQLPTVTINTNTGQGADVRPVIQYIPQYIVDNPNLRVGLTTADIIEVDNCCDDC